jgi:NitT/TauT family transport system substrate-binding protein
VRVAYASISGSMLPVWLAKDEGLYARQGLDVELIYIAGAVKIAEALLGGEIDFGATGASSAMGPGLEGADTVMVGSWTNKLAFAAVVGPPIQAVADIRGKRVGTVRRGSNSEIWAAAVLGRFGLEPERDYTVLPIGGQPEQVAALQNGAIDVAVLVPPTNLYARKLGFRELLDAREYGLEFANVGPLTTRRYLREQPEAVDRFLRASAEAVAMMYQEPTTTLAVLGRYTQMDDPELLEETLSFELTRTARDMIPSVASLRASLDELVATNPRAATADPLEFVDLAPIRRLNDSGFVAALYR